MCDAIVIGARCAGATTAMLLARHGHRVLLLERGVIPSDVHQGHFIHRHGPKRLADWGLLERIVETNCPPLTTHLTDFGDFPLIGRDIRIGNVAWGYAPRRRQLDQVMVEAAIEAGAEFRPNFLVENCLWDGDRVRGIRGRDHRQGISSTEKAFITIGADGRNSTLARAVGAPSYEETPTLTFWYFSYWSGVPLVGDAGCHKDPMMAHGICDAFRDADLLTTAIHEDLAGQCPLDDALMRYERRRNEATIAEYRENIAAARFAPVSPDLLQLRLALRGNQEDTNRFVMALEGWISQEEFFNPDNLQRIVAKAGGSSVVPNRDVVACEVHPL